MTPIERFTRDFRAGDSGSSPPWLSGRREDALSRFSATGFPTTRWEEWKYTDLGKLAKTDLAAVTAAEPAAGRALLASASLPDGPQMVFIHGIYAPELSRDGGDAGVEILSLRQALERMPERIESHLGKLTAAADDPLVALNTAMARDGAVLHLRRDAVLSQPIQLLFLSPSTPGAVASHPYVLVIAEEGSSATILETYAGDTDGTYLTNAVTEVFAAANSQLRHYRVQREGEGGFHIGTLQAHQQRDSSLTSVAVSLGGRLARTSVQTILDGPGSACTLDGLYLGNREQHLDHRTTIDHRQPHSTSRELYKGILDGHATGVFNGKVYVRPHALKSDAQQMNKNLLLSDDAEVDTKPQLEIFADDVKCSHGATIGRLDEDALFYLRARGVDSATARNLLIYAFANEMVGRIAVAPVRAQLEALLEARFRLPGAAEKN
ncbi:MAG TPA: Fe-S cluster assembly protein SufD [Terriglobales bacterium]|nr:Fe-S cluster assembly protein SufD [Terriglobales bacterium]